MINILEKEFEKVKSNVQKGESLNNFSKNLIKYIYGYRFYIGSNKASEFICEKNSLKLKEASNLLKNIIK